MALGREQSSIVVFPPEFSVGQPTSLLRPPPSSRQVRVYGGMGTEFALTITK